ncbi:MAG: adenosylcobinamide-GDP ribazoletransferase [Zetaproteobacteria bacterium]|nr:MAG: adenosylcobinamide-GDP ribazoletransferase [Zetaproteobacteria bacterium]
MRGLIAAFGLLSRIPLPRSMQAGEGDLDAAGAWFPLVGLTLGALSWIAAASLSLLGADPWVGALALILLWLAFTGGLHLDGAADLADALGAAHRDPTRLQAVLKDPHIGSFGATALATILLTRLVASHALIDDGGTSAAWLWIPAWARLGALFWARTLPPLTDGSAARLATPGRGQPAIWCWTALLGPLSWWTVSPDFAVAALLAPAAWWLFLRRRLAGMNGDALGAGIECVECLLLLAAG